MPLTIFFPDEYGEMYQYNQDYTVTIDAKDTIYTIDNMTGRLLNDVVFQNGSELVIKVPGIYKIEYGICFTDGVSTEYEIGVTVNDVLQLNLASCSKKSNAGDVMNPSGTAMLNLSENDNVKLIVINRTNTSDVIIDHCNLNLHRIA